MDIIILLALKATALWLAWIAYWATSRAERAEMALHRIISVIDECERAVIEIRPSLCPDRASAILDRARANAAVS